MGVAHTLKDLNLLALPSLAHSRFLNYFDCILFLFKRGNILERKSTNNVKWI